MKRLTVVTLSSLVNEGKKIARLSGNRDLNEKIVKSKMQSLEQYGQLIPAIVVDATDAINQGMEVIDFTTGDVIGKEEAVNYLVLLEGNHRYEAHCELLNKNENYAGEFLKYCVYKALFFRAKHGIPNLHVSQILQLLHLPKDKTHQISKYFPTQIRLQKEL